MATSALDSATDLTAAIMGDPRRSRKQALTFGIAAGVLSLMAFGLVTLAFSPDTWGLWFVIVPLLLGVAISVSVTVALTRNPSPRLVGISPRGVFVQRLAEPVPWEDVASFSAVRFPNRISVGAAGRVASAAMAAGGLNDGGRDLNIVLKDAPAWRDRVGKSLDFLIGDNLVWEAKGAHGFNVNLSTGSTPVTFESFVMSLKADADARGIPILISSR